MTALVIGAPLVQGNRVYNCAVVIQRGSIMGVAPKSYLPNYREFYERRWFAPGDDRELEWITVAGQDVRFGPDLIFRCLDVPGLDLHVEVCEDMWVPIPPTPRRHWPAPPSSPTCRAARSRWRVRRTDDCWSAVRARAARRRTSMQPQARASRPPTWASWDGQTLIYECGDLLEEGERLPDGARRTIADVDLNRLRQERLRQGSFDDNRRTHNERTARFRIVEWESWRRPTATSGCAARSTGSRSCPTTPSDSGARLLRGLQHPGIRTRAAAGRDRLAHGRDRGQRWPRLDPRADRRVQGDGPPRPSAQRRARLHDARVRDRVDHEGLCDPPLRGAGSDLRGARHPPRRRADARRLGSP